jgi:hypothetical protein
LSHSKGIFGPNIFKLVLHKHRIDSRREPSLFTIFTKDKVIATKLRKQEKY